MPHGSKHDVAQVRLLPERPDHERDRFLKFDPAASRRQQPKSTRPWTGKHLSCGTYARIRVAVADAARTLA